MTLARGQGARLWELRSAISTADLLTSEGAQRRARDLLEQCVRPFDNEHDLPDLRRAQALLAGL